MWFSRFPRPRVRLAAVAGDRNAPQKHVWRARIVLMTSDGLGTMAIARRTGTSKPTVWRWQRRFIDEGVDGLLRDASRPSRIPPLAPELVLAVDEKSQIQALDRTQPGLPMKKGRSGTMTHDYKRNGTTTLLAALDVLEGKVIGQCMQRHRHQEFLRFLNKIARETPAALDVHVILDNYGTHKHPKIVAWLKRHPRFHFHFTPNSASWLYAVEGFFAKLTRRRLKRGVFVGIANLQEAINRFIAEHNQDQKPFVWTAHPDAIIEKKRRANQTLVAIP